MSDEEFHIFSHSSSALASDCVDFSRVCLAEGKLIQVLEVVLKMMDLFTSRSLI